MITMLLPIQMIGVDVVLTLFLASRALTTLTLASLM